MLGWIGGWLVGVAWAANAPQYVLVDSDAWLYAHPEPTARRLRAVPSTDPPAYLHPPALVAQRLAERDGFVRVRTVPMAPLVGGDGMYESASEPTASWPHCYAPPPGLAQLEMEVWVRAEDLLLTVDTPLRVETGDGGFVELARGVAVEPREAGVYKVLGSNLQVTVRLPDGAAVRSYGEVAEGRLSPVVLSAGSAEGRYRADPQWRASITASGERALFASGALERAQDALTTQLSERCVSVGLSQPIKGVPERVPRAAAERLRLPVRVQVDTAVTWADGELLGRVQAGEHPLWARRSCVSDEVLGTCCTAPAGVELAGEQGISMCYGADMPEITATRTLRGVFADVQAAMIERIENPELYRRPVGTIVWSTPTVMGSLEPGNIAATLVVLQPAMRECYSTALREDPTVGGELQLRFGVGADGYPRTPRVLSTDLPDDSIGTCIARHLERMMILDAIGMDPSTAIVSLMFTPPEVTRAPEETE